jgi:hypothetical protein
MTAEMFVEPRRAANAARASDRSVGQRNTSNVWNGRAGGIGAVGIDSGTVVIGLHVDVMVDEVEGGGCVARSTSMVTVMVFRAVQNAVNFLRLRSESGRDLVSNVRSVLRIAGFKDSIIGGTPEALKRRTGAILA